MLKTSGVVCGTLHSAYLRILQVSPSWELQLQFLGKQVSEVGIYFDCPAPTKTKYNYRNQESVRKAEWKRIQQRNFTKMFL